MPALSLLLKVLAFVSLQFLYLAQSLVVVDYATCFKRGRQCHCREKERLRNHNLHRISTKPWNHPEFWGNRNGVFLALASAGDEDRLSPPRSLEEILNELTNRGISFSPMASRDELEELLLENQLEKNGAAEEIIVDEKQPTKVSSVSERKMDMNGNSPNSPSIGEEKQRNRRIRDRIQKRANRTRNNNTRKERLGEDRMNSPFSPASRKSQRKGGFRRDDYKKRIRNDSLVDDRANGKPRAESYVYDERGRRRHRRRRRSERLEQHPLSLLDSISSSPVVNKAIDIGSRAGRIARKKSGKLWSGLVDSTYETGFFDYDYDSEPSVQQSSRERRRSGFNWQQQSPRPMRRRQRRSKEGNFSVDERGRPPFVYVETPSTNYYYSDENKVTSREASFQRQKRKERWGKRQRRREQQQQQQSYSTSIVEDSSFAKSSSTREMRSEAQRGKLPIGQILAALDERNISYSPRSSRKELEDLLLKVIGNKDVVAVKKAEEDNIQVIEVESISPEDWKRQQDEKLRQKQKEQERKQQELQKKKQQVQANAKEERENPNPHKEPHKRTTATAGRTSNFYRRSVNRSYRPSGFSSTAAKAHGGGSSGSRHQQRKQPHPRPRTTHSSSPPPASSRLPNNPSVSKSKPITDETNRRIYSPFGGKQSDSMRATSENTRSARRRSRKKDNFGGIKDDFDRFGDVVENDLGQIGELFATSVDTIFWGTEDDDKAATSTPESKMETGEDEFSNQRRNYRGKRHWKDRAEERLDKIMGVHKVGGQSYDRWTDKDNLEAEEDEARGYDAISYTKGRKRRNRNKTRKAFWEEDASIFSVLLGHNWDDSRPPQRSLRSNLDDVFGAFRSSRTLTALLRNLLVLSMNFIRSLCKWASVRDTIPLPVVFLGGMGAGFVSRPGDRIKNSLLAFLSFRVLGEGLSESTRKYSRNRSSRSSRVPQNSEEEEEEKVGDKNGSE